MHPISCIFVRVWLKVSLYLRARVRARDRARIYDIIKQRSEQRKISFTRYCSEIFVS